MLSTEVTTYTSDPSSQDREESEASTLLIPLQDGDSPPYQDAVAPSGWSLNCKAMVVISVGMLLFGSGTALSLLFFTQVGNVPYLLGPLFLSMGLMFLVTGLVWLSILKQSLEHRSFTTVNQVEWRSGAQTPLMENSG
ncbi:phosphoinositide-interacting protein-like [Hippoglossus hippoglossus]|uniref:phosphoinositide-interacting protein-like n=1 Tax=Hippoglossus hippoglossus TaxID=8267 RepID=UPI00148C9291|nr:phosphoinositide-interacting protein-like [Hippoglossus hippoglossus]